MDNAHDERPEGVSHPPVAAREMDQAPRQPGPEIVAIRERIGRIHADASNFNKDAAREKIRGKIAISLLALIAAQLVIVFAFVGGGWIDIAESKELLSMTLPATTGLFGAVTGFYFGAASRERKTERPPGSFLPKRCYFPAPALITAAKQSRMVWKAGGGRGCDWASRSA